MQNTKSIFTATALVFIVAAVVTISHRTAQRTTIDSMSSGVASAPSDFKVTTRAEPNMQAGFNGAQARSIDELRATMKDLSDEKLNETAESARHFIDERGLIAKANRQILNAEEAQLLRAQINIESAANLILVDRKLERMHRSYL